MESDNESTEGRFQKILSRIHACATHCHRPAPTLIAVSKTQSASEIEKLYKLGHRDFGENYVQELIEKNEIFNSKGITDIRWHFIGHLQSNKVKSLLAQKVFAIHSVDSLKLAEEISKRGGAQIFLEVNIDSEDTKSGILASELPKLAEKIATLPHVQVLGLMCIPAPAHAKEGLSFKKLKELEIRCRPFTKGALSMGMTDDFEAAIRENSTHIRIGTAIFGARTPR